MSPTIKPLAVILGPPGRDVAFGCIIGIVCLLASCSSRQPSDQPATFSVTGIVTYQDRPVEGATVTFIGEKYSATGRTDAQGRYRLTTFQPGDGAVPGEYQVSISKFTAPLQDDSEESEPSGDEVAQTVLKSEIPEKYANPQTSHLRAKVLPQSNELDFSLR